MLLTSNLSGWSIKHAFLANQLVTENAYIAVSETNMVDNISVITCFIKHLKEHVIKWIELSNYILLI